MGKKITTERDLGFGFKVGADHQRMLNPDGTFNVIRKGESRFAFYNLYHQLIRMRWIKFILIVFLFYGFLNLVFAGLYYLAGTDQLAGINGNTTKDKLFDTFFFSAQTLTTVGYGRISPVGHVASIIASLESFIGLMVFALATGLLYARFASPNARLLFSSNALVAPYQDGKAIMFRMANLRSNQLIEVEVQVVAAHKKETNGKIKREFTPLTLERSKINFLPLSWTIVHPIDESSIFYNKTAKDLEEEDLELTVLVKAFDETYSQTVHDRTSYKYNEFVWGSKFLPMFRANGDGTTDLYLNKINDMEIVS
jgi:inward rectifier potassium channel